MKMQVKLFLALGIVLSLGLSIGACSKKTEKAPASKSRAAQPIQTAAQQPAATPDSVQTVTKSVLFTFDQDKVGQLPAHFSQHVTGRGKSGIWKVVSAADAISKPNVVEQTSKKYFGYHFNVLVNDSTNFSNLDLTVHFKALTGQEDQGGGPIWRYQNADNYYIARANPLENNFRVYKVVDGNRKMLATVNIPITTHKWHTIRIKNVGDHIQCYYDGQLYLNARDTTFTHGKIGLWTKADAVTQFDDLSVKEVK
ncbi:MAG: hypothetical protein GXO76_15100 [Calditrichaeota bacterium]|nr:hypothetical protein [Calditrichota bacterium]